MAYKKLTKKIRLDKGGFMRIYLPNKLQMTIWDSYSDDGCICVCVHRGGEQKKLMAKLSILIELLYPK